MKDFKNSKQQGITQRNNSKQLPPPLRDSAEQKYAGGIFLREVTQKGGGYNPSTRKAAFTLAGGRSPLLNSGYRRAAFTLAGGRRPLLNSGYCRAAFTLAEVLITLAVISIVAVLTIPALVQNNNEKAWSTAKDVFSKRLDVAMKAMNTDGTLTGYTTTEDFVNALKKNIKINQVCTDDVTKCFAKKIQWRKYGDNIVDITKDNITFSTDAGQDWAETVGVRFANGVNALIAYNKNCSDDPFNNQYSPSTNCIGIVYDVQANKQPNTYGKDIDINKNIAKIDGKGLCEYELKDGTCFSKILAPDTGYSALSNADCMAAKNDNKIDVEYCYNGNDYYAGAVLACGGKKDNLPSKAQLHRLATEIYPNATITEEIGTENTTFANLDIQKVAPFLSQSPGGADSSPWFYVWSNFENTSASTNAITFVFRSTYTNSNFFSRTTSTPLAVCVDN